MHHCFELVNRGVVLKIDVCPCLCHTRNARAQALVRQDVERMPGQQGVAQARYAVAQLGNVAVAGHV